MPFTIDGNHIEKPKPSKGPVKVREMKRKKALLTCIFNLDLPQEEIYELARFLKARLGCGGTIHQGVIELQGSWTGKVQILLQQKNLL